MRLSTKGRYAVTAMVDIAQHSRGSPVALNEIAQRQAISLSYLEQLFAKLRRAGLVNSVRGPGGGYVLSRDSDQIRISAIVLAVDTVFGAVGSRDGTRPNGKDAADGSVADDLWGELDGVIASFLGAITVGDVCSGRVRGFGQSFANGDTVTGVAG